jgi:hypothetical protein
MTEGQHRTGIEQYRLIALLDQVNVALKNIVVLRVPDPPDAIRDLNRMMGLGAIQIVDGVAWHHGFLIPVAQG